MYYIRETGPTIELTNGAKNKSRKKNSKNRICWTLRNCDETINELHLKGNPMTARLRKTVAPRLSSGH